MATDPVKNQARLLELSLPMTFHVLSAFCRFVCLDKLWTPEVCQSVSSEMKLVIYQIDLRNTDLYGYPTDSRKAGESNLCSNR